MVVVEVFYQAFYGVGEFGEVQGFGGEFGAEDDFALFSEGELCDSHVAVEEEEASWEFGGGLCF